MMLQDFIPGQRWISRTELKMGLGTILTVEHRMITVLYLATGETRIYAKQSAPLSRVMFAPGDKINGHDQSVIEVTAVQEQDGLLTYIGVDESGNHHTLEESQLDNFMQLSRPSERLFSGQIDHNKWFDIRYHTRHQLNQLNHSELYGLVGCRTDFIPHQLYIAHEIAHRYAPRVLLADEVGLGKTIEAGLICHQQLLTERAKRILIVVPESLMHQWLVEMLRRFNLYFSIFDETRCQAVSDSNPKDNPFHTEQLVLCSLEFLSDNNNETYYQQALAGAWDLLVVDEVHHLQWSTQCVSHEYQVVEQLAEKTKGILLLTATPEQLGKESHFARLRLLDANRFPDFDAFIEEEAQYEPIANIVNALLNGQTPTHAEQQALLKHLPQHSQQIFIDALQSHQNDAKQQLLEQLLDQHGTGRILFRNTRTAIKGFPERQHHAYPLILPPAYKNCLSVFESENISVTQLLSCPELLYQTAAPDNADHWTDIDPRVAWLHQHLIDLRPTKVLVITASSQTACDLAQALKIQAGIYAGLFHEGLTLVERDRSAAFFADHEHGCQVLICSEIGSEGRNFQFAQHLVLFDLPVNPDLLEQRIGRLDRIGQQKTIHIHVPYLEHSAQAVLYQWYHQGLSAFERTCPAGYNVYTQVKPHLINALHHPDDYEVSELIETSRVLHQALNLALQQGRDRLLEYNSCRQDIAQALKQNASAQDGANSVYLKRYMDTIFDAFGIHSEEHSDGCYIIKPGDNMLMAFPGLPDDGMTLTYDRDIALANEDIHYFSWEHPFVGRAMEMAISNELGNTTLVTIPYNNVEQNTLLLECVYVLESTAAEQFQVHRYLPTTMIRIVIDEYGNEHSNELRHLDITETQTAVTRKTAVKVVTIKEQALRQLLPKAEQLAKQQAPSIINQAHQEIQQILSKEIARLEELSQINPNVRQEEIDFFQHQLEHLEQVLNSTKPRLDAIKVMIATAS